MLSTIDLRRDCCGIPKYGARGQARAGFTLLELILVLLVVVILSGLAVPSLVGLDKARANLKTAEVRALIVYAQQWAIGTNRPTWVTYEVGTKRLEAYTAAIHDESFSVREKLADPLSHSPIAVDLTDIFQANDPIQDLYGQTLFYVKFDSTGTPVDSADKLLTNDVLIPLTDQTAVRIRAGTGLVSVL